MPVRSFFVLHEPTLCQAGVARLGHDDVVVYSYSHQLACLDELSGQADVLARGLGVV